MSPKILRDVKFNHPTLHCIMKWLDAADEYIHKYPNYEVEILRNTLKLIQGTVDEALGNPQVRESQKSKHKFFEQLIAEIEDVSDLGIEKPATLDADTLERIWKSIPEPCKDFKVLVVRMLTEAVEHKGKKSDDRRGNY